ncbi:flagellar biosynthetic protein FliR [Arthrobacter sp. NEB 688]|uniref:flagellar biosynthetic protein FliR n=1 Tax=Arthrobacter sp. NEB 688 TaxID=904039 RepID=UPI0015632441|nr:flagellar biosynthetic protein FliR [Arthrobacter sp. NEB 688]QKE82659.1 flagellar biosynthetic protein FliR [Arthrobacter sp. NEB 688]
MTIAFAADSLVTMLLATVRVSVFFILAPPFSSKAIPMRVKAGLAVALSLAVLPALRGQAAPALELFPLVGAALYQAVVGAAMGFVVLLAFAVVQAAGELLDLASGFTLATLYDPMSNASSSIFGRIHQLLAITLLFASGGHLFLVRGLISTFTVLPLHPMSLGDLGRLVTDGVGAFVGGALQVAGPVLVVLFLAEIVLGLVSRAVPTLNIFAISFPVKIILVISFAGMAFALLPGVVSELVDQTGRDMTSVARMLGARG